MHIRLGDNRISLPRYLLPWSLVAVAFALQGMVHDLLHGNAWPAGDYLRWAAIPWFTWAALAPWVFGIAERHPLLAGGRRGRALATHAGASVGLTLLALAIGALVSSWFEPSGFGAQFAQFLSKHAASGVLTYWMLVAIQQALHFRAEQDRRAMEASRLAAELAQSRLHVLRSQLHPHFLFNTLHAISTLLSEDAPSAEDMLLRLSELLRTFLEDYDGQEVSLREELVLLDLYLGIQRTRFRDRLTTRIHIAPDTIDALVPSLILQPIVENAIRHGIGERVGADCIEIESRREGDQLCIDVRNRNSSLDGGGNASAGHGIGLANTRLRLQELYGDGASLRLDMAWPQGVACRIRVPFRQLQDPEGAPELVST
jgi:two-component system, LytTR family, sensor kinase